MADDTIANDGSGHDPVTPAGVSGSSSHIVYTSAFDLGEAKFQGVFKYARLDSLRAPANDNTIVEAPGARERGFEPGILSLHGGDTLLTWVGPDGHAHGHVCGPMRGEDDDGWISPPKYAAVNSGLSDLGRVAPTMDGGRRLQAVEPRPGTFAVMWLALTETGVAARGKIFLPPGEDRDPTARDAPWTERPIGDVSLPGFERSFRVTTGGTDQVLVSYDTAKSTHVIVVPAGQILGDTAQYDRSLIGPAATHSDGDGSHRLEAPAPAADFHTHQELALNARKSAVAIKVANEPGVGETAPTVTALGDGFVVAWQTPPNSKGISQFKLTIYDEHGGARRLPDGGTVLVVSDNVAADTPPVVSEFGDGFAVAYKHGDDGKLAVKAYGSDYAPLGEETIVDAGASGPIYDIAASTVEIVDDDSSQDQLAVAYVVEDADPTLSVGGYHYGNILLQRLGVFDDDGGPHLVALGPDGSPNGVDEPAPLTIETPGGPIPVVGRSPSLAGLDNGGLAIVWVESDGTRETIRGEVLEQDGNEILRLDLTNLIEYQGIVRGTTPDLFDAGGGDILVSWLQYNGHDDYVVMAALYDSVAHGVWVEPDEPIRLKSFDEMPDDYSVALSHADGLSILVTWDEDSSGKGSGGITTQSYDINGEKLGGPLSIKKRALTQDEQVSPNSLAAAGLTDGEIVVVYAEQGARGDSDLAAHVVDVGELISAPNSTGTQQALATPDDDPQRRTAEAPQFSTAVDQEIAIDLLGDTYADLNIARINGEPISTTTPIDVGAAWVQLRDDGWLTVSPNFGYEGLVSFEYTVASPNGEEAESNVIVSVEPPGPPGVASNFNQLTSLADTTGLGDAFSGDLQAFGTEGLFGAGLDASMFTIVGSTLYLKEGVELDFGTTQSLTNEPSAPSTSTSVFGDLPPDEAANDGLELTGNRDDENEGDDATGVATSGYEVFRRLMDAGALAQVGDDVVITMDIGDPAAPHTITLRGVSLSSLMDTDFKF